MPPITNVGDTIATKMPKGAVLRQAVTLGKAVFRQVRKQGQTDCRGSSFQLENGR